MLSLSCNSRGQARGVELQEIRVWVGLGWHELVWVGREERGGGGGGVLGFAPLSPAVVGGVTRDSPNRDTHNANF